MPDPRPEILHHLRRALIGTWRHSDSGLVRSIALVRDEGSRAVSPRMNLARLLFGERNHFGTELTLRPADWTRALGDDAEHADI